MPVKKIYYKEIYQKWKDQNKFFTQENSKWNRIYKQNRCNKNISITEDQPEDQWVSKNLMFYFIFTHNLDVNLQTGLLTKNSVDGY